MDDNVEVWLAVKLANNLMVIVNSAAAREAISQPIRYRAGKDQLSKIEGLFRSYLIFVFFMA